MSLTSRCYTLLYLLTGQNVYSTSSIAFGDLRIREKPHITSFRFPEEPTDTADATADASAHDHEGRPSAAPGSDESESNTDSEDDEVCDAMQIS